MNLYGFRRLTKGDDIGAYFHPKFQMNHRELLSDIRRLPGKGTNPAIDYTGFEAFLTPRIAPNYNINEPIPYNLRPSDSTTTSESYDGPKNYRETSNNNRMKQLTPEHTENTHDLRQKSLTTNTTTMTTTMIIPNPITRKRSSSNDFNETNNDNNKRLPTLLPMINHDYMPKSKSKITQNIGFERMLQSTTAFYSKPPVKQQTQIQQQKPVQKPFLKNYSVATTFADNLFDMTEFDSDQIKNDIMNNNNNNNKNMSENNSYFEEYNRKQFGSEFDQLDFDLLFSNNSQTDNN